MSFGLNLAQVIGRLGADVTINRVRIPSYLQACGRKNIL